MSQRMSSDEDELAGSPQPLQQAQAFPKYSVVSLGFETWHRIPRYDAQRASCLVFIYSTGNVLSSNDADK